MNTKLLLKKYSKINVAVISILFLLSFALLYFFYYRQRNQGEVYVKVSISRSTGPQTTPQTWVPYWIDQAINIGDQEINPLGGLNAQVLDKESYEGSSYSKYVYLLLKVKAIRDRSGIYLFKNKPLSVGGLIDLKLNRAQIQGAITFVDSKVPSTNFQKIMVTIQGKEIDPWVADAVKIGSTIVDNKEQVLAKVVDKKVTLAQVRVDTSFGQSAVSYNKLKRDLEVNLELLVKKIDDNYYFSELQKIKVDENLFLPFTEEALNFPITSVTFNQ